eukprot:358937-Chlamydomonas_euryale.AAC.6
MYVTGLQKLPPQVGCSNPPAKHGRLEVKTPHILQRNLAKRRLDRLGRIDREHRRELHTHGGHGDGEARTSDDVSRGHQVMLFAGASSQDSHHIPPGTATHRPSICGGLHPISRAGATCRSKQ